MKIIKTLLKCFKTKSPTLPNLLFLDVIFPLKEIEQIFQTQRDHSLTFILYLTQQSHRICFPCTRLSIHYTGPIRALYYLIQNWHTTLLKNTRLGKIFLENLIKSELMQGIVCIHDQRTII